MKIETSEQTKFASVNFAVDTPEGKMFVAVLESDAGDPIAIQISIGKAGLAVNVWAQAVSRLATLALEAGRSINDIIHELTSLGTDRSRTLPMGEVVRSGPDGLMVALMRYRTSKYNELRDKLGRGSEGRRPRMEG